MAMLRFVSKGSHLTVENLNSIYISNLHLLLTVQMQQEETLPIKSHRAPVPTMVKSVTPLILMVLFVHYMSTREQNLLLYDLSVHWASTERHLPNMKLSFNIVLKTYEVLHNLISCLLN